MTRPSLQSPQDSRPLVLVVDDEPGLRHVMVAMLREHYRTLTAADGREALALLEVVGRDIAAVVTDIRMPGMDGLALAAALRDRGITVPILFVSGFRVIGEVPGPVLRKPFEPDDLLSAVQRLVK